MSILNRTSYQPKGKVFLVGAGPGDPDLITVRGLNTIKKAEVLVYDRLANPELLSNAPKDSERIYVGKRPDKRSVSQEQISRILVAKAKEGKTVVRLKGGDSFVFGRGGEECEALAKEGIHFEIVPGISSAIAAPAYAGIPLTHRGQARSFTVVTGYTKNKDELFENWENIAHSDTLVILMGMKNLPAIISKLYLYGRSPETPVAIIEKATYDCQRTVIGTLDTIVDKAAELSPPATIVIGKLAALGHDFAWFKEPYENKNHLQIEQRKTVTG
ncbi:uroporphyrinogen-III C-methyltransferase [Rhodohalobacter sp. SW132]|uniref:uroporphyrinogen-III C-methyltransferase n=1 Tax=Rhodohalobacter sp. SW132 TaxID=2293433 RepID=UPI000E24E2F7|nr:uroporphyrinogen-III C-methyltransferase [Rhodohalobacter sp. SW132]REL33244.1 uroporphyrinogen-III C-methyltransferase [Rhodohalobacter sp. SW132]